MKSRLIITVTHEDEVQLEKDADQLFNYAAQLFSDAEFEVEADALQIPILGWGIVAIKNSFMVASFNVTGKIEDPTITPAPLGTLSEMFWSVLGIPKNIIGLGEPERREEAKEPAKTPASK